MEATGTGNLMELKDTILEFVAGKELTLVTVYHCHNGENFSILETEGG